MSLILNGTDGLSDVDGTAATPAIRGTDANTGIFFSAADTIDFAEGGAACGQFDSSSNFKFNSGYGSVVTAYGCRSWVNFNGQGTVAIRASGNVSSITDNGSGNYNVNFTTTMPDANYCAVCAGSDLAQGTVVIPKVFSTSNVNVLTLANDGSGAADAIYVNVAVFR